MTTNQQQVGALLKAVIAKGVETKDAVPTIKNLIEAKIFNLSDLTEENVPSSLDPFIRNKLLPKKRGNGRLKGASPTKRFKSSADTISQPPVTAKPETIVINRSPVLTLWATIVAKNLYTDLDLSEALTLGSAAAAQMAKSKGTSLGIYEKDVTQQHRDASSAATGETYDVLGMTIHAVKTDSGIRATANGEIQNPNKTWNHLKKRFQDSLGFIMERMDEAAKAADGQEELRASAYRYYMHIRPNIPDGTKGWGAHGRLETSKLSNFFDAKPTPAV
ncbi:hypothetical protein IV203_028679 [Nitzschia inconspicua]|uniref:Uncharacterized protein n=1 Tax=Nitzschia inconspicua TaxID=303405 RepID=A0A9K3LQE4_9STRA|nr:hypothetical protein IV203_028679 [Nitzschia inconspicua]